MRRKYKSRGGRLTAVKTKRHVDAPQSTTFDDDNREVLRQTRQIHSLESKRRELKRKVEELTRELKGRRRGLRTFLQTLQAKRYGVEEFDSEARTGTDNLPPTD